MPGRLGISVIAVLFAILPLSEAFADEIVATGQGAFEITRSRECGGDCQGDLVSCTAPERLVVSRAVYFYLEGVCDDTGATPCDGRYTALLERCRNPFTDQIASPGMRSILGRGPIRACFDDTGAGDCTGAVPAGIVIFEGEVVRAHGQTRLGVDSTQTLGMGVVQIELFSSEEFSDPADIETKRYRQMKTISHRGFEPPSSETCGFIESPRRACDATFTDIAD